MSLTVSVALEFHIDAHSIAALELERRAWTTSRALAIGLILGMLAVLLSITPLMLQDALSIVALPVPCRAIPVRALRLVQSIFTIRNTIANSLAGDAFSRITAELGFGAWSGRSSAALVEFVLASRAVRLRIAHPTFRNAFARRTAPELADIVTGWAFFSVLIRIVAAIVVPITGGPTGDTSVRVGASNPSFPALDLSAFRCLIGGIPTVVLVIAGPRLRDASVVGTSEFFGRTGSVRTQANLVSLIRSPSAIIVSVTNEPSRNAFPGFFALELPRIALLIAVLFIGSVAAVIGTVANLEWSGAVVVSALEFSDWAHSDSANIWSGFVFPISAVLLAYNDEVY